MKIAEANLLVETDQIKSIQIARMELSKESWYLFFVPRKEDLLKRGKILENKQGAIRLFSLKAAQKLIEELYPDTQTQNISIEIKW